MTVYGLCIEEINKEANRFSYCITREIINETRQGNIIIVE